MTWLARFNHGPTNASMQESPLYGVDQLWTVHIIAKAGFYGDTKSYGDHSILHTVVQYAKYTDGTGVAYYCE